MTPSTKTCFKCSATKTRADFYAHPQMADGLLGKCKECTKSDVRRRIGQGTREYDRRRYRERTHEHKARMAVTAAITAGRMKRPDACWHCGKCGMTEGHHADYSNQLGVIFLCKACHMQCHKETTAALAGNGYAIRLHARMDRPEHYMKRQT